MSTESIKVAVIVGSVRDGRFGPVVANWFIEQARSHGLQPDVIDLMDYPLPVHLPNFGSQPAPDVAEVRERLGERLTAADAFVIITPEYNHGVPASVKNVIDWFMQPWAAKPFALVSYGGMGGGVRAAEQLRQILPEVHATTIRDTISFHNAWGDFGAPGEPASPAGSEEAAKQLIEQLLWWGRSLKAARAAQPYNS
jgi:NAD(P)H-dependent FMN reductase